MASLAAILAIGKPVAFDASAEDRETRGFISMTTSRPVGRLDRELDVAAAGVDPDRADDVDADVAHPLVLAVGQGQGRRDGDGVAGVHAHRVDVLDRADDDDVVGRSRISSSSYSFQPRIDSSRSTSVVGLAAGPRRRSGAGPPRRRRCPMPAPPMVNDGRTTSG